ncbi:MAG: hypothetical protein A2X52_02755 [Candidatus Rokubacteria bacterium GWC2_70_16]|nr:MAG: hypothetical protein A2X52_02755 [Candidatus Rokubacteria bacterium GWC2_70_16]
MQSYIVRIYRWGRKPSRRLVGVVEQAEGNAKRAFGSLDELWQILSAPRSPSRRRKAQPGRQATLRGIAAGAVALLLSLSGLVASGLPPFPWGPASALAADPKPGAPERYGPVKLKAHPPPPPPGPVTPKRADMDFLDANPAWLPPGLARVLYPDLFAGGLDPATAGGRVAEGGERRRTGAVADGLSRLLVKVQFDVPGRVVFRLVGQSGELGSIKALKPRGVGPGPEAETATFERDGLHVAYALYTPPRSFDPARATRRLPPRTRPDKLRPGQERTLALEYRTVDVFVDWVGLQGGPRLTTMRYFDLLRPPVVLVHGTYDGALNCWDWAANDVYRAQAEAEGNSEYVTDSFARQLEADGFAVFLPNYQQSNGINKDFDTTLPLPTREEAEAAAQAPPGDRAQAAQAAAPAAARVAELASHRSHFSDNARVVWEGGRPGEPVDTDYQGPGEGIKAALEYFRDVLNVAVTRADVVGHSMGGVLARVYARGVPLSEPAETAGGNWYRRPDNWNEGDINRLITLGSTHKGSHLPSLLIEYMRRLPVGHARAWRMANWGFSGQLAPGAFTDQEFDSDALKALGPTRVPSHAIAGVATAKDLDKINVMFTWDKTGEMNYRTRVELLWKVTPESILGPLFKSFTRLRRGGPTDADAADLARRRAEFDALDRDLAAALEPLWRAEKTLSEALNKVDEAERQLRGPGITVTQLLPAWAVPGEKGQRLAELAAERERLRAELERVEQERERAAAPRIREISQLKERRFLRYVAAGFYNDWTDFTVSLDSALGGLAGDAPPDQPERSRWVTIIPGDYRTATDGVLHSFEPRHVTVQARIKALLRGGLQEFNIYGFPGYSPPRYLDPPAGSRPHEVGCSHAPRLCPPAEGG